MTATSVVPFATLAGQVASSAKPSQVVLHINAGELRADQSPTAILGFYVAAADGSSVAPEITKVTGPNGTITPVSIPPHGNTAADKLARQSHLFARVIPLATQAQDITLNVSTLNKKTGNYIVEAYLAGDVNGDGTVDATDLAAEQVAYGARQGDANYSAAADFNGDGRDGCIDRNLTIMNLGAHVIGAVAPATATSSTLGLVGTNEVNLVPSAATPTTVATAVPVAVATPVALGTTGYVPVTLTPSSAIPVAATTTAPVVYAPVDPASGAATYANVPTTSYASVPTTGYPTAVAGTTPVYYVAQPAAVATSAAPIYVYGQPLAAATSTPSGTATSSLGATLFGATATGQPVAAGTATPLPVYLYTAPTAAAR